MTDESFAPDDELVSAYLDGEATPEERARVDGDPELLARVEELRAAAAAMPAPLPRAPADALERILAAAHAAADEVLPADPARAAPGASPGGATVVAMPARRRPPPMLLGLSVAAAVIVVVGFLALALGRGTSRNAEISVAGPALDATTTVVGTANDLSSKSGGGAVAGAPSSTTTAEAAVAVTSTTATAETTRPPVTSLPPGANGGSGASTGSATSNVSGSYDGDDLGALGSSSDVRSAVGRQLASTPTSAPPPTTIMSTTTAGGAASTTSTPPSTSLAPPSPGAALVAAQLVACDASLRAGDAELGALRYAATATYQGRPALVLLYAISSTVGNANGPNRIYVVGSTSCQVLDVQTF